MSSSVWRFLRVVNTEAVAFSDNPDQEWNVQVISSPTFTFLPSLRKIIMSSLLYIFNHLF